MSTEVRHRRGTAAQHSTFTGALSEFTHDTTNNTIRVHDGVTAGGHQLLNASNNLSELSNAATARTNLGLGTAATTAASAYATAAQGTKADNALTAATAPTSLAINILKLLPLNYVTPVWWGMATDATASVNAAAITSAIAENKKIELPRGLFNCASITTTLAEASDISLIGSGPMSTVLNFGSSNGIQIDISSTASEMQADKTSIEIEGIGFQTELTSGAGIGLYINYPDSATGTASGTSILRRLRNLCFSGRLTTGQFWGAGLRIRNGSYMTVENVFGSGPETGIGGTLLDLVGAKDAVDNRFVNLTGRNLTYLSNIAGKWEGLTFQNPIGVNCTTGINWSATAETGGAGQPWLNVSGGHFNVNSGYGIYADNVVQMKIENNLIYLNGANSIGILTKRTGASSGVAQNTIIGNTITNVSASTGQAGIQLDAYTGQSIISNNLTNAVANGIVLLTNSNGNTGTGNLAPNISGGSALVNNGTSNTVTVTVP